MIVAGFGFRAKAEYASLKDALEQATVDHSPQALATLEDKIDGLRILAQDMGLPLIAVSANQITKADTFTQSAASHAARDTGSVAEAAALAAAGNGAKLLTPRHISQDRMATCAIAIGGQT